MDEGRDEGIDEDIEGIDAIEEVIDVIKGETPPPEYWVEIDGT